MPPKKLKSDTKIHTGVRTNITFRSDNTVRTSSHNATEIKALVPPKLIDAWIVAGYRRWLKQHERPARTNARSRELNKRLQSMTQAELHSLVKRLKSS